MDHVKDECTALILELSGVSSVSGVQAAHHHDLTQDWENALYGPDWRSCSSGVGSEDEQKPRPNAPNTSAELHIHARQLPKQLGSCFGAANTNVTHDDGVRHVPDSAAGLGSETKKQLKLS